MPNKIRPYGTWPSPITPAATTSSYRLRDVKWDTATDTLIWHERRGSGSALVVQGGQTGPRDLVRDEVIGGHVLYGGGGFTVNDGVVYYVGVDERIFRVPLTGGIPQPITPVFGKAAAPAVSADGQWLVYVHSYEGHDSLATIPTNGSQYPRKLIDGPGFVMQPAWHPSGSMVACITWDDHHMPWNRSQLHLIQVSDGEPFAQEHHIVAGGDDQTDESVFGTAFSPDGRFLAYASDRADWWHIYLYDIEAGTHTQLTQDDAEYGMPAWLQDMRTFGWSGNSEAIYALRNADSVFTVQRIDIATGSMSAPTSLNDYTHLEQIAVSPITDEVAVIAGNTRTPDRIVTCDPASDTVRVRSHSSTENIPMDYLSPAEIITWDTSQGIKVQGFYNPPTNPDYASDGLPPLIVHIHSGPTRQRFNKYFADVHFFTSRGFAVLEPNYRGSTGYGKRFKDMLHGNYGTYEVEDSARGADYLVNNGLAERSQRVVRGSSSGGFSALQSLILMPSVYRAAIAVAPVTDHFALAPTTHKFERHYNNVLLGELPEASALYHDRSPLYHAGRIADPVALFHGKADTVVPYSQSEGVAQALRRSGVPHILRLYEGEGHSISQPQNLADYYNTVLDFLVQYVIYS